jgi:short-subunit dehydrogenase
MQELKISRRQPEERWALVTGASAGIGAEFCRQLAALGYSVILVARRESRLSGLANELVEKHEITCHWYSLDLSDPKSGLELSDSLKEKGIEIEFLVNNAGYGIPGYFTEPDWQEHIDFIQVLVTSVCELTWRFLPAMRARGIGYVVNVSSLAGLTPGSAGYTLYGASKSFLVGFSESLAMENHQSGVSVSALCPGFTYTEFHDVMGTRERVRQMSSYMWMTAEEVVRYGIESVMRDNPRVIAIPGRVNRFLALIVRLLPMSMAYRIMQRQSRRFRAQTHNTQDPHYPKHHSDNSSDR